MSSESSEYSDKSSRESSPDASDEEVKPKKRKLHRVEQPRGEVFIRKIPALPAGKTPYKTTTIHPNTLTFLEELKLNNDRDWFQQRELQFRKAKEDFDSFVLELATNLQQYDDTIPTLPVKDLCFRIYRDVRFSNDRTPYKTNLSAAFSRTGRKGRFACYYVSIQPGGKTILACGLWQPNAEQLREIRAHIAAHGDEWDEIIEAPEFKEFFGGLSTSDRLKTCPKGYAKDHERIEMLRLKSFTVSMSFTDEEATSDGFLEILGAVAQQMEPFVTMLNEIID